jgi:hypothetical protein
MADQIVTAMTGQVIPPQDRVNDRISAGAIVANQKVLVQLLSSVMSRRSATLLTDYWD